MPTQLIVTEKCRGLYRTPEGTPAECGHPISHFPAECGPDTIARPYTEPVTPVAAVAEQAPRETAQRPFSGSFTVRLMNWVRDRNADGWAHVGVVRQATLFAFAALVDETGLPVSAEQVARVVGNAPSTAQRHLKECPLIVKYERRPIFVPAPVVVSRTTGGQA